MLHWDYESAAGPPHLSSQDPAVIQPEHTKQNRRLGQDDVGSAIGLLCKLHFMCVDHVSSIVASCSGRDMDGRVSAGHRCCLLQLNYEFSTMQTPHANIQDVNLHANLIQSCVAVLHVSIHRFIGVVLGSTTEQAGQQFINPLKRRFCEHALH